MAASVSSEHYGQLEDGQNITRYTLSNSKGMCVKILDYGGIVQSINVPDKNGQIKDVVLGFDTLKEYREKNQRFFGVTVGRFANRIARGKFTLDGETYQLPINNGPNSLHGGIDGFQRKVWKSSVEDGKVVLVYVSPDGEEGYPGEVTLTVTFSLDEGSALTIDYHATCNKATPVNFTNHSYFNLAGQGKLDDHVITLSAETYLPVDETSIPTGEFRKVSGTEFDLRSPVRLGDRLRDVRQGLGFDHCYCLGNKPGDLVLAARVEHPASGRLMELHTTEPGIQYYTGANVKDIKGKGGVTYDMFCGMCIEPQHYPDSVNQPGFPNVVLRPGQVYTQKSVYKFGLL